MKNPSTTAAFVLVGLALLVGGFAYLTTGDEAQDKPSDVITQGSTAKVGFTALTPREQRKKSNLEEAKRKLKRIRETGKEVMPGVYRMKEENGEPIYYLSELVEGVGRNGEPMYMAVEFKRRPMVPLKEPRLLSGKAAPKVHPVVQDVIQPMKPKEAPKSAQTGGGGTGGGKQNASDLTDG
ncbi:MAG: hypothetical protein ACYTCU_04390 [Planctomycetota bacterium]